MTTSTLSSAITYRALVRPAMRLCTVLVVLLAWATYQLWPLVLRLWRLPRVLVPLEAKDPDALRLGILGASFIARVAVVAAAGKRSDVAVVAVAARELQRARSYAQRHGIPHFHGGERAYEELLQRQDVEAVYIGLPTELHLHWATKALQAGKHVLLEKPAVLNTQAGPQRCLHMGHRRRKSCGRPCWLAADWSLRPATTATTPPPSDFGSSCSRAS